MPIKGSIRVSLVLSRDSICFSRTWFKCWFASTYFFMPHSTPSLLAIGLIPAFQQLFLGVCINPAGLFSLELCACISNCLIGFSVPLRSACHKMSSFLSFPHPCTLSPLLIPVNGTPVDVWETQILPYPYIQSAPNFC